MILLHRINSLEGLSSLKPSYWGFDTVQVAWDLAVNDRVSQVLLTDPNVKIVLAFIPSEQNSPLFTGSVFSKVYEQFEMGLSNLKLSYGDRILGVRWNHEYRPTAFYRGSNWVTYASRRSPGLYQYIEQRKWDAWQNLCKKGSMADVFPVSFLESTKEDKDLQKLFSLLIEYQSEREAIVINTLVDITKKFGLSFILYPCTESNLSPRMCPKIEYTLDLSKIYGDNIIWEMASWDFFGDAWLNSASVKMSEYHPNAKKIFSLQSTTMLLSNESSIVTAVRSRFMRSNPWGWMSFWSTFSEVENRQIYLNAVRNGLLTISY